MCQGFDDSGLKRKQRKRRKIIKLKNCPRGTENTEACLCVISVSSAVVGVRTAPCGSNVQVKQQQACIREALQAICNYAGNGEALTRPATGCYVWLRGIAFHNTAIVSNNRCNACKQKCQSQQGDGLCFDQTSLLVDNNPAALFYFLKSSNRRG